MPGIVLKRSGERVRHSVSRLSARSCSHMEPESAYAARGAVLAHLSGSGRSRALWTSTLQALHVARLCADITGDPLSRIYLERSQCDLDHTKPPPGVREVSCTHHFAATVYYTYLTAWGCYEHLEHVCSDTRDHTCTRWPHGPKSPFCADRATRRRQFHSADLTLSCHGNPTLKNNASRRLLQEVSARHTARLVEICRPPAGVVRGDPNWQTQAGGGGSARNRARFAAHVDAMAASSIAPASGCQIVSSHACRLCSRTSPGAPPGLRQAR